MATQTARQPVRNANSRSKNVMANISKLLERYGAVDINVRNPRPGEEKTGFPNALTFSIMVKGKELHFKMAAKYPQVRAVLLAEATTFAQRQRVTPSYVAQVTWATILQYLDAALALVRINQMEAHEVLLGQMLLPGYGETFFDLADAQQFQALPEPGQITIHEVDG